MDGCNLVGDPWLVISCNGTSIYKYGYCMLVGGLEYVFPFHIWDVILPILFPIVQDGENHQPVWLLTQCNGLACFGVWHAMV